MLERRSPRAAHSTEHDQHKMDHALSKSQQDQLSAPAFSAKLRNGHPLRLSKLILDARVIRDAPAQDYDLGIFRDCKIRWSTSLLLWLARCAFSHARMALPTKPFGQYASFRVLHRK